MKRSIALTILPGALAVMGIVMLTAWRGMATIHEMQMRVPGADGSGGARAAEPVPVVGDPVVSDVEPVDMPGWWPRFRGDRFDNICDDGVALARSDGKEIWRTSYPVKVKRNHGMSRTVPALTDEYVVALGPKCHVTCLDVNTGEPKWIIDLVGEYGATVPQWWAGQCPLIDGDNVILAPGGDALVIAVDLKTGELVWRSPNPRGWIMTHVSIMPMNVEGRQTYVYCGSGGVAGISAEDGSLLWETIDWQISKATVPSPTILEDGKIFLSGGYAAGALMLQIKQQDEQLAVETLFRLKPKRFGSTQHTPILFENHIYGVREQDKELVCLDLEGNEVWSSGSQHRFGIGPYMIADNMIFVMDDEGTLTMAQASPAGYKKLGQAKIMDGHDSWGPMAMAAGRLIVRDMTRMVCLDVAEKREQN